MAKGLWRSAPESVGASDLIEDEGNMREVDQCKDEDAVPTHAAREESPDGDLELARDVTQQDGRR